MHCKENIKVIVFVFDTFDIVLKAFEYGNMKPQSVTQTYLLQISYI